MADVRKQTLGSPTPKTDILSRIKPIGFDDDEGIKALIYGQSGSGKTTLWSSFPKPILALVISGGDKPGELRSIDTVENRKVISSVNVRHTDEIMDLIGYAASSGKYKTLVMDHVSGFQDRVLSQILGKPVPEQKSWGTASQQQYGQCTQQCKELLRELLSLSLNVVLVGQEKVFGGGSDDATEAIAPTVGAALMPQLGGWVNCAVDYIVHTFKRAKTERRKVTVGNQSMDQVIKLDEVEFCLRTGPHETFVTKFRVPKGTKLPNVMADPTYDKILALIKGAGNTTSPKPTISSVKPGMKPGGK